MSNILPSIMTSTTSKTFPTPDITNIKTITVETTNSTTINHLAEVMEVKEECVVIPTASLTQKCRRGGAMVTNTCKLKIAVSTTHTIANLPSGSVKVT